jgi:hypothetical protein
VVVRKVEKSSKYRRCGWRSFCRLGVFKRRFFKCTENRLSSKAEGVVRLLSENVNGLSNRMAGDEKLEKARGLTTSRRTG